MLNASIRSLLNNNSSEAIVGTDQSQPALSILDNDEGQKIYVTIGWLAIGLLGVGNLAYQCYKSYVANVRQRDSSPWNDEATPRGSQNGHLSRGRDVVRHLTKGYTMIVQPGDIFDDGQRKCIEMSYKRRISQLQSSSEAIAAVLSMLPTTRRKNVLKQRLSPNWQNYSAHPWYCMENVGDIVAEPRYNPLWRNNSDRPWYRPKRRYRDWGSFAEDGRRCGEGSQSKSAASLRLDAKDVSGGPTASTGGTPNPPSPPSDHTCEPSETFLSIPEPGIRIPISEDSSGGSDGERNDDGEIVSIDIVEVVDGEAVGTTKTQINPEEQKNKDNNDKNNGDGDCPTHIRRRYIPNECTICLLDYEAGDRVTWSSNPRCVHAFHEECIVAWLGSHVRCPVCRRRFLLSSSPEDSQEEGATSSGGMDDGSAAADTVPPRDEEEGGAGGTRMRGEDENLGDDDGGNEDRWFGRRPDPRHDPVPPPPPVFRHYSNHSRTTPFERMFYF